jgi:hypothetical protein
MNPTIPIIIHFVGLALFSSQVPNDCGLKVILPKVVYTAPKTVEAANKMHHVEDHQAVLIFRTDSYIPTSSWGKPVRVPKLKGQTVSYEYVTLDGDRVRFDSGIDNQGLDFDRPQLPPLGALCPAMTTLDRRFQPPYNGAAAVFDLPQGAVKACNAGSRIDTEVKFDGDGTFIISASTMRTTKELRLRPIDGKVELIVANVPVNCLRNGQCEPPSATAIDGMSHVNAYYKMVTKNTSCKKTIADWIATTTDVPSQPCSIVLPPAAGGPVSEGVTNMTDLECSNSRFP